MMRRAPVAALAALALLLASGCARGFDLLPATIASSGAPPGTTRIVVAEEDGLLVIDPITGDSTSPHGVVGRLGPALRATSVLVRSTDRPWDEGTLGTNSPETIGLSDSAVTATYTVVAVTAAGGVGARSVSAVRQRWEDLANACGGDVAFVRTSTSPSASLFDYSRIDLATAKSSAEKHPYWTLAAAPNGKAVVGWDHNHLVEWKLGRDNVAEMTGAAGGRAPIGSSAADTYEVRWSPDSRVAAVAPASYGLLDAGPIDVFRAGEAASFARIEAAWPVCWTAADTLCVVAGSYGLGADATAPSGDFELWSASPAGPTRTATIRGIGHAAQSVSADPSGSGALAVLDGFGRVWICAPGQAPRALPLTAQTGAPAGDIWVPFRHRIAWVYAR